MDADFGLFAWRTRLFDSSDVQPRQSYAAIVFKPDHRPSGSYSCLFASIRGCCCYLRKSAFIRGWVLQFVVKRRLVASRAGFVVLAWRRRPVLR
jgi:hypothetical protein